MPRRTTLSTLFVATGAIARRFTSLIRFAGPRTEVAPNDDAHMRKVVGYVHRHSAQRPSGDVSGTKWRYSLMNWGHDPEKK